MSDEQNQSRVQLLEKQDRLLRDIREIERQIVSLKFDIKIHREQIANIQDELDQVGIQLEGNQIMLGTGA